MSSDMNTQLILIAGESTTGKSFSLKNIPNQSDWMYLNTEAGKRQPYKNDFATINVSDPYEVHDAFQHLIDFPEEYTGVIVDSLSFLMDMVESQYVLTAPDTRSAWGDYAQFMKTMMQQLVVQADKPTIFTAHTRGVQNPKTLSYNYNVPIKGALANQGIEAYFSTVVHTKVLTLDDLEPYMNNGLLTLTEDEEEMGIKHVFQTRPTKDTANDRIRSPFGMFTREQTYMDNDAIVLLNHLNEFYG